MKYTVRLIEGGCVCSHEMLDVLVVWHTYLSSMYIAYQYVKKICMDLLTACKKGQRFQ